MDREISRQVQRKQNLRRLALWLGAAALAVLALLAFRWALRTELSRAEIRTAVAERGVVEHSLSASGEVLPEFEEILASPVTASIKEVYVSEGTEVQPGQQVLSLDKEALLVRLEKLKSELELKRNSIRRLKLELEKSLFDLAINDSIKGLNINSLEAQLENARRLLKVGGATQEQVEQAALNLKVAELEKRKLENDLRVKQEGMKDELREREIEAEIQAQEMQEMERKLARAELSAQRTGVVTWINRQVGGSVQEGEPLARIAGLGNYRLEGTVSGLYASRIGVGMPALVRINDSLLQATITNIRPAVENDVLTFDLSFGNPNHPLLRPKLRVELFVITDRKSDVLRVANGPAFNGQSIQELFVLKGDKAVRRRVSIGLSNFDQVEIESGLAPGEEIIISDMSDYEHLKEIDIKK